MAPPAMAQSLTFQAAVASDQADHTSPTPDSPIVKGVPVGAEFKGEVVADGERLAVAEEELKKEKEEADDTADDTASNTGSTHGAPAPAPAVAATAAPTLSPSIAGVRPERMPSLQSLPPIVPERPPPPLPSSV